MRLVVEKLFQTYIMLTAYTTTIIVPAMVWTLVFGFVASESRRLAAFRRAYNATADKTLSPN